MSDESCKFSSHDKNNIFGKQWKNRLNKEKKNKKWLFEKQMEKSSHECFLIYFLFRQAFGEIFEICEAIWSQTVGDNLILFALAPLIYWGHRSWWLDIFPPTRNPKMRNGKLKILFPQRFGERSGDFSIARNIYDRNEWSQELIYDARWCTSERVLF